MRELTLDELIGKIRDRDKIYMDFVVWAITEPGFAAWFPTGDRDLPDIRVFRVVW